MTVGSREELVDLVLDELVTGIKHEQMLLALEIAVVPVPQF